MKRFLFGLMGLLTLVFAMFLQGKGSYAADDAAPAKQSADRIFVGSNIITMDGRKVEAVAIAGDKILAAGEASEILLLGDDKTRVDNLGKRTLLPGFIDAHGHIALHARFIDLQNISSPPVGEAKTISDIQRLMKEYIKKRNIPEGQEVVGYGYDESLLKENRHPTRQDLDAISTKHPIILLHVSLHLVAANSATLAKVGYTEKTPNPPGGVIRREKGTQIPNGVLEETAGQRLLFSLIGGNENLPDQARRALVDYARFGYTTAQDGASSLADVAVFRKMAAEKALPIDLHSYLTARSLSAEQRSEIGKEPYVGGFRIAGFKYILDGSIQGKTGFLTQPYIEPPKGEGADYRGYPSVKAKDFQASLTPVLKRGVPVLIHSNGDAAIDMMLDGVENAFKGSDIPDHRAVIIHAQMMREDQLDRARKLGVVPSFFSAHPFYWGDWHRQILGDARASRISPIRSAIKKEVPFTIHNDAPVVPPDAMRLIWATVNRETRSGHVLGADQKATVMEALYATTLGAAYQLFEEDNKGSITAGKQADLVILDSNPLTIDPGAIKDIKIVETISRGRTVVGGLVVQEP